MSGWPLRGKKMTPIRSSPYRAACPLERGFNCYYFINQRKSACKTLNAPYIFCKFTLDISKVVWYSYKRMFAGVVELVDTRDLKSLGSDAVPVRARPPAPLRFRHYLLFKISRRRAVGSSSGS